MDLQGELTESERWQIADRLLAEQRDRFGGVRKAAYTATKVNPATWARVTSGLPIRSDRLIQIVQILWPQSKGRWELVPPPAAPYQEWPATPEYVEKGPWDSAVDNAMADVDGRFIDLEQRLRDLEQQVADLIESSENGEGGEVRELRTPANQEPEVGPADQPTAKAANESGGDDLQTPVGDDEPDGPVGGA